MWKFAGVFCIKLNILCHGPKRKLAYMYVYSLILWMHAALLWPESEAHSISIFQKPSVYPEYDRQL